MIYIFGKEMTKGGKDHSKFSIQDKQLVVGVDYANKSSI